jgi:hypothetical protein
MLMLAGRAANFVAIVQLCVVGGVARRLRGVNKSLDCPALASSTK